jgi:chromosome partitioning protein
LIAAAINMSFEIQQKMKAQFGNELSGTVISENVALAEAPALHRDIYRHAKTSRSDYDYCSLLERAHNKKNLL